MESALFTTKRIAYNRESASLANPFRRSSGSQISAVLVDTAMSPRKNARPPSGRKRRRLRLQESRLLTRDHDLAFPFSFPPIRQEHVHIANHTRRL